MRGKGKKISEKKQEEEGKGIEKEVNGVKGKEKGVHRMEKEGKRMKIVVVFFGLGMKKRYIVVWFIYNSIYVHIYVLLWKEI